MDQRGSFCPYLLSSETTAKGTGLVESAGKEDPVELDSSQTQQNDSMWCRQITGRLLHLFLREGSTSTLGAVRLILLGEC